MKNHATIFRRIMRLTALLLVPGLFAFTACFEDGGGNDTNPESYNSSLFVSKSEIGPGAECANGGVRIDMGFDVNRNNVLDPEEVTNTEYVCHGEDASSHPFVVYTWPTPNETDVTRSAKVSVVFNTEMDPATVTESTLTVSDEYGDPVSGTVEYNDITAVFTPDNRLAPGMKYTVTAFPAMENVMGTALGYEHKVFFHTFDKYTVAYHANGATEGTVPAEAYYADGSGVNVAGNTGSLAKTGSPFMGWCTASDGTGTCYDGGEPITISSADVDLYARWGHSISFNKNDDGATGTMDPQTMATGAKENLSACTFTKPGWHFTGWSTTPGGEVEYEDGAEFSMGTGNVVLYAKWIDDPFTLFTTPGQQVTITVGTVQFKMRYANNQASIIFPFSPNIETPVDGNPATLTRKFFMSETQVTNALMAEVLQWAYDNGKFSTTVGDHNGLDSTTAKYGAQQLLDLDDSYMKINYSAGSFTVDSGFEDHPVVSVTWYGAIMFCNWLTEMRDGNTTNVVYTGIDTTWVDTETVENADRNGYRLPSSQEWEYSARYIGTTLPIGGNLSTEYVAQGVNSGHATLTAGYYWTPADYASGAIRDYNNVTDTRAVAWYSGDPDMGGSDTLMPVAQKTANHLGLYDMSGNVWEWCFDLIGSCRVYRGGSWNNTAIPMQVGYLFYNPPSSEYIVIGFRFARTQ
ncbi:MAG: SUMF1/EgtB/PvdO family nonheme iron enzyme [Spirochaetes bacterium]|nr:SUMF1/EgtB/PvdO family nonheme iron enzyme [Spirochaetota bacterium]